MIDGSLVHQSENVPVATSVARNTQPSGECGQWSWELKGDGKRSIFEIFLAVRDAGVQGAKPKPEALY